MNTATSILGFLACWTATLALCLVVAHGLIYSWKWTTKMPGGLERALRDPFTMRGQLCPDALFIGNPEMREHYHMVTFGSPLGAIVWLSRGEGDALSLRSSGYITVLRFTQAYALLRRHLSGAATIETARRRIGQRQEAEDDWRNPTP